MTPSPAGEGWGEENKTRSFLVLSLFGGGF